MKYKRFFIGLMIIAIVIGGFCGRLFLNNSVHATTNVAITYQPFTDLFYVVSYDDSTFECVAYQKGTINQSTWLLTWVNNNTEITLYTDGNFNFTANTMYLVKGTFDGSREYDIPNTMYVTNYDNYLIMYGDSQYYGGYSDGVATIDYQAAFDSGKAYGYDLGLNENSQRIYDDGYYNGLRDGAAPYKEAGYEGYDRIFNAGKEWQRDYDLEHPSGSVNLKFYDLLKSIVMYPYQVVKEGMDVDIFDVNIGGLIIGLFMLGLVLFVIRLFLRGGSK